MANGKEISLIKSNENLTENCTSIVNDLLKVYIPNSDMVDPQKELERLNNELKKTQSEIERAERMLNNPGFVARAPKELIEGEKAKLIKYNEIKNTLLNTIAKYSK